MKKITKCVLKIAALGAAMGGAFAYLKNKGYITVTKGHEDEDLDDFSTPDSGYAERTYIHVDTNAMKEKAKEMVEDFKEDIKDKAEDAYDEAKKMAGTAAANVANAVEKAWYETEEKVEEFFNDEEA